MKKIFLTCGTRGAGKSTYCKKVLKRHPEFILISRDEILIKIFGSTELNPYEGGHYYANEVMWRYVRKRLARAGNEDIKMILDCWNGFPEERVNIISKLKNFGADEVEAWVFITPLEKVIDWFDKKNRKKFNGREMNESRSRNDYKLFNKMAAKIDKEGFDKISYINPLRGILV